MRSIGGLLAAGLAACGFGESSPPSGHTGDVDVQTLHGRREAGEVPVLVDVRTASEFGGGHVPGALPIPMKEVTSRLDELSAYKDGPVYVICHSGGRSAQVVGDLRARGWNAINVMGGTSAWIAAGYATD